ncbi:hypothetical protein F441_04309 [Phytophthora nicotianae CJ01A1]|uniref:Uncharacterized protein n=3 Tax=Phytophthora nicotianae TaxID=4792 RepID=W2L1S8_PHYNI|nr:hypothetical protein L915_04219 [Phytophthora nicotianae]ETL37636.1 hypothetical protein L916_10710 [Phytophthora nicotianae]ETL90784.1 hypothetical protein L917_10614 [Phytophthora nicotianae]ETP22344.1 hypothetical protein F441_04309 [Phytophthora nicotianae CJ01A1]
MDVNRGTRARSSWLVGEGAQTTQRLGNGTAETRSILDTKVGGGSELKNDEYRTDGGRRR